MRRRAGAACGAWRERKFDEALALAMSRGMVKQLSSELFESVEA